MLGVRQIIIFNFMDQELENIFPQLASEGYELTSPETPLYNCIAWSVGDNTKWWWPNNIYYWPEKIPCTETVDAFQLMYESFGFSICDNYEIETGFEKIALYINPITKKPTHASRQLPDGKWTSKLGCKKDISHNTLVGVEGTAYGVSSLIMKRPC